MPHRSKSKKTARENALSALKSVKKLQHLTKQHGCAVLGKLKKSMPK
jgi:hypothetical protein